MKIKAYAKINLTLDITGRRADGYHMLEMIMQSVDLYDLITVNKSNIISVRSDCAEVPSGEGNIVYSAARRFFDAAGISGGAEFFIEKYIPSSAGLGGGSADAAAALRALNRIYNYPLDEKTLMKIALSVGADVPFCMVGGTAFVQGTGEKLKAVRSPGECGIVLIKPCAKPSTGEMYALCDSCESLYHPDNAEALSALEKGSTAALAKALGNSFSSVWNDEKMGFALSSLEESGALGADLSGSGPTVFGIYKTSAEAVAAVNIIKPYFAETYAVNPVKCGYEIFEY